MQIMSTYSQRMICLILLLLNALSAMGGMSYSQFSHRVVTDEDVRTNHAVHDANTMHRQLDTTAPESSSPSTTGSDIDYTGCYMDLNAADMNYDGAIQQSEYNLFVKSYGKRVCYDNDAITLEQTSTFHTLACLCTQMDSNGALSNNGTVQQSNECCLGSNSKLLASKNQYTYETTPVTELTVNQLVYYKTICFYVDATMPKEDRNCTAFEQDDEEDVEDITGDEQDEEVEDLNTDDYGVTGSSDNEEDVNVTKVVLESACKFDTQPIIPGELFVREYSDPIEKSITIQLVYNGIGWLGFGFVQQTNNTSKITMLYNTAVIGLPNQRMVHKYDLTGRSITGVKQSSQQTLIRSSVFYNTDQTILTFTQSASELGDDKIYNGTYKFIYAVGQDANLGFHKYYGVGTATYNLCQVIKKNVTVAPEEEEIPEVEEAETSVPTKAPVLRASFVPSSSPSSAPSSLPTTSPVAPTAIPTGGQAFMTTAPTAAPNLRGSKGNGIDTFLSGNDIDDDEETSEGTKGEIESEEMNNEGEEDTTSRLDRFISWLRRIWVRSSTDTIIAYRKND